ncbi:hypothetical protein FA13DRAFT_1793240 [Coprinellus micaceus]|uniref:Uncharacterized protein n=1 Tax=Coprinellus micaceus TaxID=71717 RepID=A0A4Y7T6K2_COPMI|nr:hypothetical protein FA13DRAFT_1793240 [Coprinellus micaceus]
MSAFDLYLMPLLNAHYSAQYFNRLDFNAVFKLQPVYPVVKPSGSIGLWVFDTLTPMDVATILRMHSNKDHVQLIASGVVQNVVWHFIKIHLFVTINNNQGPILLSLCLWQHIEADSILSGFWRSPFQNIHIHAHIVGFMSPSYLAWKCGYFLEDEWIEEDITNTLAEFTYLKNVHLDNPANILILSTLVYNKAVYLLGSSLNKPQFVLSPNLLTIHEHIQAACLTAIYFLV